MDYPMLQPQIEYQTEGYSFKNKEEPCRVRAYAFICRGEITLLPDGCEELVAAWGSGVPYCARPNKTELTRLEPPRGCHGLCGIRLEPGYTVNIPAAEAKAVHAALADAKSPSEARDIIFEGTAAFIMKRKSSAVWEKMAETVCASRGRSTVASLAERYGYTVRQVNNLFRECAACSPKTFCRLVRFRNALLEMANNPEGENSEFIERLSYADQAHFQREFKEFTGMTPRRFAKLYFMPIF
ncbi:MAG: helix-turn-helix domain-containing protein [Butyrivibrio sp.]|nr:helix-turn-helix domain-containing protein [Butyrivibrio sp.]